MSEAQRLKSWTATLPESDAAELLDRALPGMALSVWEEQAHGLLPQSNRVRRTQIVRFVRETLLDHDGQRILPSTFLSLFQEGSPHCRRHLFAGRYLFHQPLIERALSKILWPALRRLDEPLAPEDAAEISPEAWAGFLEEELLPETRPEARKKTLWALRSALERAGVLEIGDRGQPSTIARRSRPDPLAFSWLVLHELKVARKTETPEDWALSSSFAARLFAPYPEYARSCLEAGVGEGLLRRGYLVGAPRLYPVEVS